MEVASGTVDAQLADVELSQMEDDTERLYQEYQRQLGIIRRGRREDDGNRHRAATHRDADRATDADGEQLNTKTLSSLSGTKRTNDICVSSRASS